MIKKLLFVFVAMLSLIIAANGFGFDESCLPSGLKTSSGEVYAGGGTLCGIIAVSDGTNTATCTVYDNATTGSGTVIGKTSATAAQGTNGYPMPVQFGSGTYLAVSGTGSPGCMIFYKIQR